MTRKLAFLAILAFWISPTFATDLGRGLPSDILHIHHPPDPVNVRNGNFFLPIQDYYQPCFGPSLEIYRSYNSLSSASGPLGLGWSFNYNLQISISDKDGIRVTEPDGFVTQYIPLEYGESKEKLVESILKERKKADAKFTKKPEGKGARFYKAYVERLKKDSKFRKRQKERFLGAAQHVSPSGRYISRDRGLTYLETNRTGFIRSTASGDEEIYNKRGLLVTLGDRNGNRLSFSYDSKSRLTRIDDSCKQYLQFKQNRGDRIMEIRDHLGRKISFTYDGKGRMTSSSGKTGKKTLYSYDKKNRLDRITFSDGDETSIGYSSKTGKVVRQVGPGSKETKYTYGKTEGVFWSKVSDNLGLKHRYKYIEAENKIVFEDGQGNKTTTLLDSKWNKPTLITDLKGRKEAFSYDENGNLASKTTSGGKKTTFEYEPRFSQVQKISEPDGSALHFKYDKDGNLSFARKSKKEYLRLTYEGHGKIATITDQRDQKISFTYSKIGKPTRIEKHEGAILVGSIFVIYDDKGEIQSLDYSPKGDETMGKIKGTLSSYLRLLKPSGIDFEI